MSAQPRAVSSGSGGSGGGGWQFCADNPVLIKVGGTRIPTQKVETYVSKDGPADINTTTIVYFPAEWRDKSVINEINSFGDSQSSYEMATVSYNNGNGYVPTQRGYVRGVGGATETNGLMKMAISDPSTFTTALPFKASYTAPTVSKVLSDIQQEFTKNTIFGGLTIQSSDPATLNTTSGSSESATTSSGGFTDTVQDAFNAVDGFLGGDQSVSESADLAGTQKKFRHNRATVKDVLDWLTNVTGGNWHFSFDGSNLVLVVTQGVPQSDHTGIHSGGNVNIINNDALEEIVAQNSVRVNGATGVSIGGHDLAFFPSKKYPTAVAEYPPLIKRTGNRLKPKIYEAKATRLKSAENVAKRKLKNHLESIGQGDIKCHGYPYVSLHDRLTAKPICAGQVPSGSVLPTDYEVQGITHVAKEGRYTTRLNVSMFIDYSKIQISESKMVEQ